MNNDEYAIYLRKSRSDIEYEKANNKLDTLLRHERVLNNLAELCSYNIVKTYKEVISGETIKEREQMQHLLADVKARKYKGVLVVEVSRLTRGEKIDQGIIKNIFKYSNTLVITKTKVYDLSNKDDERSFDEALTTSGKELDIIKTRLSDGRLASVLEGKYVGNIAPFGYERVKIQDDKGYTLKELPKESIIIKKIFELFVYDDLSQNKITIELDKLGFKPRKAEKWSPSTIKDILRNPVYIGKIRWYHRAEVKYLANDSIFANDISTSRPRNSQPKIVNGLHIPIISQEVWDLAQLKLSNNKAPVQHNNIIKNPLSHLLVCEKCGSFMQRRPYKKTGEITAIQCNNRECNNISSKLYIVENKIIEGLQYWLKDYKMSEDSLKNKSELYNITYYKKLIKQLEETIVIEEKRFKNVCIAFEDGTYDSKVYENRSKEIKESISQIEHQIIDYRQQLNKEQELVENKKTVIPKIENVLDVYYKLESAEEKNRLLKTVIEKVTYLKEKKALKKTDDPTDFEIHIYPKIAK